MRLLIISHAYAPARNPRAFRWTSLAEHWARNGHEVVVVTASAPGLPMEEVINGVQVHRAGGGTIETMRTRFAPPGVHVPAMELPAPATARFRSLFRKGLKRLHDLTWKKLYWPDFAALWIAPAIRVATDLLRSKKTTVVISVSIPFSSHVVGYFLRRRGLAPRWIADIGDPFAFMVEAPTNNHTLYGGLNFRVERSILYAADAVSVTTEGTLRRYLATYPQLDGKVFEIPPLANTSVGSAPQIDADDGNIRLVYTGTLHQTIRGPDRVLALFGRMLEKEPALELHFYGNHLEVARTFESLPKRIRDKVFLHGEVERSVAVAAMRSASSLINIGNDTTYQLPSKLVEYAAAGKPVINVVARQNDSSVQFFKQHPCVFNVIGDEATNAAGADAVLAFVGSARGRSCAPDPDWLSRFSIEQVAGRYQKLFEAASQKVLPQNSF